MLVCICVIVDLKAENVPYAMAKVTEELCLVIYKLHLD